MQTILSRTLLTEVAQLAYLLVVPCMHVSTASALCTAEHLIRVSKQLLFLEQETLSLHE